MEYKVNIREYRERKRQIERKKERKKSEEKFTTVSFDIRNNVKQNLMSLVFCQKRKNENTWTCRTKKVSPIFGFRL